VVSAGRPAADARLDIVPSPPSAVRRVVEAAARKGVELHVVTFSQSTRTAAEAASAVSAEVGQIVKSLVFVVPGDDGPEPYLVLASGSNTVDLARLSAVLAEPRIRRATADEARQLTGFSIGGIPPFGHRRSIRTVMDPDLGRFEFVWAAAGTPNAVFQIAPATLSSLTNAFVAPIATAAASTTEALRGASTEPSPASGAPAGG
jgi:prolyl-tRNA editing enzyme YbaK/EbsC (Cys-tRNA(Pro) deacylase)